MFIDYNRYVRFDKIIFWERDNRNRNYDYMRLTYGYIKKKKIVTEYTKYHSNIPHDRNLYSSISISEYVFRKESSKIKKAVYIYRNKLFEE